MIMANPEHTPEMEPLDRLTVALYRSGLSLFALVTLLEAAELLTGTARAFWAHGICRSLLPPPKEAVAKKLGPDIPLLDYTH